MDTRSFPAASFQQQNKTVESKVTLHHNSEIASDRTITVILISENLVFEVRKNALAQLLIAALYISLLRMGSQESLCIL